MKRDVNWIGTQRGRGWAIDLDSLTLLIHWQRHSVLPPPRFWACIKECVGGLLEHVPDRSSYLFAVYAGHPSGMRSPLLQNSLHVLCVRAYIDRSGFLFPFIRSHSLTRTRRRMQCLRRKWVASRINEEPISVAGVCVCSALPPGWLHFWHCWQLIPSAPGKSTSPGLSSPGFNLPASLGK